MAEQRIDGTLAAGAPTIALGNLSRPSDDRIGATWSAAGSITRYRMRGWSASLSTFVEWIASNVDAGALQAPSGAGTITDVVWMGLV